MNTLDHQVTSIELSKLIPHPQNANVMPPDLLKKLRHHMKRTGRYEPLVVRPHPTIPGSYELINGHHRKRVLQELGHKHAACVVWQLDDAETLLLLATVNRLAGHDSPSKRLQLLESLSQSMKTSSDFLADLLPESRDTLRVLLHNKPRLPAPAPSLHNMPEAFTIFLPAADKQRLLAALKQTHPNPATAILQWLEIIPPPAPNPLKRPP